MESKKHYKLVKSCKQWIKVAVITTACFLGGLTATTAVSHADAVKTNQSASAQPAQTTNVATQGSNVANSTSTNNQAGIQSSAHSQLTFINSNQTQADTNKDVSTNHANNSTNTVNGSSNTQKQPVAVQPAAENTAKNGVVNENGATYYYINNVRQTNHFYTNSKGQVFYFGNDGKEYKDRFYQNWGHTYYFGPDGARYTKQFYQNWGRTYYFGELGIRYTNQFYQNWGHTYYFGWDGARYTNQWYTNWGRAYYFGDGGVRATSQTLNLGYGNLTFDKDGVLTNPNSFIGSVVNGAIQGWIHNGVLPSLTIAQAIIESGWGRSTLASRYHNLFGIKGSYHGKSVVMATSEYYGGWTTINDRFRAYDNNDESVQDHTNFLTGSRYRNLLWDKNYRSVTYKIRADGYATAPSYTTTLRNTIERYNLTRYDRVAFALKG